MLRDGMVGCILCLLMIERLSRERYLVQALLVMESIIGLTNMGSIQAAGGALRNPGRLWGARLGSFDWNDRAGGVVPMDAARESITPQRLMPVV